jgi:glycosyltransferase involved in cell wall biosynthesis
VTDCSRASPEYAGPPQLVMASDTAVVRRTVVLACDFLVRYTAGLAGGMLDNGADVLLVTRAHDGEFGGEPGAMQRHVQEVLGGRGHHLVIPGRVRSLRAFPTIVRGRGIARRVAPAVLHFQDSVANDPRLCAITGARRGRYALTVHDPAPHPGDRPYSRRKRLARWALIRGAGLIFAHAQPLADELRTLFRPSAPVEVVPHGVDTVSPLPLPAERTLLFFGRVSNYKGLDTLLDAMPTIWTDLPDVRLLIAGEPRSGLHPTSHPILSDRRVQLIDHHVPDAEVPDLFARASAVVLPYRQASQSGVGTQAQRFGRAIVATDVGGLPELVGSAGRIVPPEDPAALARASVELLGDSAALHEAADAATATARAASWDTVARVTLEAYARHLPL